MGLENNMNNSFLFLFFSYQVYLGGDHTRGMLTIVNPEKELNDGHWHNVTLIQKGRTNTLRVDSVSVSEIIQEEFERLNLNGYLFTGGMSRSHYERYLVKDTRNFRGCIEDLTFRGINIIKEAERGSSGYETHGKVAFLCEQLDYRVVTMTNPNAGFRVTVRKLPADNDTFSTSFQFRSHIKEGLLLSRSAIKVKMYLRLSAGALLYDVTAPNGSKAVLTLGSNLDDGEWHKVNATVRGREVRLHLDGQTRAKPLNYSKLLMLDFANKSRLKIFLGGYDENRAFPGFVGCLLNLKIDSQRITLKNLKKSKHTSDDLRYTCRLENRCKPNPCRNQGRCSQDWKEFHCDCEYTQFEGKRCEISIYKPTCEYYRSMGLKSSEFCLLDSIGEGKPYTALCNLTQESSRTYTIITHDKMTTTGVKDAQIVGTLYRHDIKYTDDIKQIKELIRKSKKCRQHIRFHCYNSKLLNSPDGPPHAIWWSRDGVRQNYWGGAAPGSGKCACGMPEPSSCEGTAKFCNCDVKDLQWRVDEGYLTDKSTLPVTRLEFNKKSWRSDFTLGALECWGIADNEEIPSLQLKPKGRKIDDRLVKACPNVVKPTDPTTPSTKRTTSATASTRGSCIADDGLLSDDCTSTPTSSPNVTMTTPYTGDMEQIRQTTPKRKKSAGDEETGGELSTIAVVMISGALVVIVLLSMKFGLPRVIMCVRTHSKRGEYIVPPAGSSGYPARLLPLVAKNSSFRGRQLAQYGGHDRYVDGNTASGIKSYWV